MQITLPRPDDWHLHLRDGAVLRAVVPHTSRAFGRALVMPNLVPPVTTVAAAEAYRERILAASDGTFEPKLTCYLTDTISADEVAEGHRRGAWIAAKLYPANATTHSEHGVTDVGHILPVLERMAEIGMPLCVHGEVTDRDVDVFDRERVFLERVLRPIRHRFPTLRIVLEHVTTEASVRFVREHDHMAATITPHHLWWNRNAIFDGGLRPHAYCLPVLKRERDRVALVEAATSGDERFFAGTDSAPHSVDRKECDHGCAGVFCAPPALEAYATVFERAGCLEALEGFVSVHGARFYGFEPATETVTLVREEWTVPETVAVEGGLEVRPFLAGETLPWRLLS